jgi:hypothetical protein
MLHAPMDHDDLAGARDDPLPFHPEAHRSLDDLEALLLERVGVQPAGDPTVRWKLEVDRDQLAARVRGGLAEGDPLAARRVLKCLSYVGHLAPLSS